MTGIPSGHMPGSLNLPFMDLLDADTKQLKKNDELEEVFENAGIDLRQPIVASCGTGECCCLDTVQLTNLFESSKVHYMYMLLHIFGRHQCRTRCIGSFPAREE